MLKRRILTSALILLLLLVLTISCGYVFQTNTASAEAQTASSNESCAEPMGLYTNISLDMGGYGDGKIWAKAKNKFTLGKSTVRVNLELYSSEEYCTDYTLMTLEGNASTNDLDQGKTLELTVLTGGKTKYWLARMYYRLDSKDWVYKTTQVHKCDANGIEIA